MTVPESSLSCAERTPASCNSFLISQPSANPAVKFSSATSPPEFFLDVQETAETGAAALQFGLQLVEYLLDLGQLLGVVGCGDKSFL